jgi:hypothetical protein
MGRPARTAEWLEAERGRPEPAEAAPAPSSPAITSVLAVQRSAGNAATAALLARTRAPVRLIQREPDEQKVKERAHELWVRKGKPIQTPEQEREDYFEAQRQVRIEERAYANWQGKPGGGKPQSEEESRVDYIEAEEQLAKEAAAAAPSVEAAVKEAEIPKDPGAVAAVEAPMESKEEEAEEAVVAPPPVAVAAPPPKYVTPIRRGVAPIVPVAAAAAPAPLAPGWRADAQLNALNFYKQQGRWQRDVKGWQGFQIHLSVNPVNHAFDEYHVKFDLPGTTHRVYYFYDVTGNTKWDKSTNEGAAKAALRAAGCPFNELKDALKEMDRIARFEADWLASRLR